MTATLTKPAETQCDRDIHVELYMIDSYMYNMYMYIVNTSIQTLTFDEIKWTGKSCIVYVHVHAHVLYIQIIIVR